MFKNFAIFSIIFFVFAGAFGQSDSLNMHLVGTWEAPAMLWGWPRHALAVQDTFAFIAGGDTLYILNIADPTTPTVITRYVNGHGFSSIVVDDTILCTGNGRIIDISDIENPADIGSTMCRMGDPQISLSMNLYVGWNDSIVFYDISKPDSPFVAGKMPISFGLNELALSDSFLHLVGYRVDYDDDYYSWDVGEYYCYNIADPESPEFVNYRDFGDYSQTSSIDAVGMTAYVGWSDGDGNPLVTIKSTTDDTTLCTEGVGMGGIAYIDLSGQYWCYTRSSIPDYIVAMDTLFSEIGYYRAFDLWGDVEVAYINDSLYVLAIGKVDDSHCALYIIKHDTIFCQIGYLDSPHRNGEEYRIFPNPILQGTKLTLDKKLKTPRLFDISGREMKLENRTINTSELSPGIYLLVANLNNKKIVKKLVVLK